MTVVCYELLDEEWTDDAQQSNFHGLSQGHIDPPPSCKDQNQGCEDTEIELITTFIWLP
jgi:hypothetical protein